jgi:hypothetical protein
LEETISKLPDYDRNGGWNPPALRLGHPKPDDLCLGENSTPVVS